MYKILIAGAGYIGQTAAHLLARTKAYEVHLIDNKPKSDNLNKLCKNFKKIHYQTLDINDSKSVGSYIEDHQITACVCCLPFHFNVLLAEIALATKISYFNLTEDVATSKKIETIAADTQQSFVQHCGLAPGFIDIVATDLMKKFETIEDVKLRCGALPQHASNALQYAITWSIDGLINEYCNPCPAIEDHHIVMLPPLGNIENIQIDGSNYEAFNTSGGLGDMPAEFATKVNNMNYKSIRYPGHCAHMKFLLEGLKLQNNRQTLIDILAKAIPSTHQDVVLVYVSVSGYRHDKLHKETFVNKYYPQTIDGILYTAIQVTTAAGLCAIIDLTLNNPTTYQGITHQSEFSLDTVLNNRFGELYEHSA